MASFDRLLRCFGVPAVSEAYYTSRGMVNRSDLSPQERFIRSFTSSPSGLQIQLPSFSFLCSDSLHCSLFYSKVPVENQSFLHDTLSINMRTSSHVIASILALTGSAFGAALPGPQASSPAAAATPTAVVRGHDPAYLPEYYAQAHPSPTPVPDIAGAPQLSGDVTWAITNSLPGTPAISIVGAYNAGAKPPRNSVSGTFTRTTNIVVPSGWAGAFTLDKVGGTFNTQGSRIEGNWGVNDPDQVVYADVSYVTGYSVPITCSCGGQVVTGCNTELFSDGISCPERQGTSASPVCINTSPTAGPPQAFFAPCRGAAYTFPKDDGAVGTCNTSFISCCVGSSCPRFSKQP